MLMLMEAYILLILNEHKCIEYLLNSHLFVSVHLLLLYFGNDIGGTNISFNWPTEQGYH